MAKEDAQEIVFTQSRLSTFEKCERLEYWQYRAGGSKDQPGSGIDVIKTPTYFVEGEFGHYALKHWYRNAKIGGRMLRKNMIDRIESMLEDMELTPEEDNEYRIKLAAMVGACHAYKGHYKPDFQKYEFVHVEEPFEVQLAGVTFKGIIDLIVKDKDSGMVGFWEHKFLSQFSASDYACLPINLQQLVYTLGFESIMKKAPKFYMWNVIMKSKLRRKGMKPKKDGSMPVPEPLVEFENRVQKEYMDNPEKMFRRPPPRLVSTKATETMVKDVLAHIENWKAFAKKNSVPPMRHASCIGMYGTACPFANACAEKMLGHAQGWNAPACRGLYRRKEHLHPELAKNREDDNEYADEK